MLRMKDKAATARAYHKPKYAKAIPIRATTKARAGKAFSSPVTNG